MGVHKNKQNMTTLDPVYVIINNGNGPLQTTEYDKQTMAVSGIQVYDQPKMFENSQVEYLAKPNAFKFKSVTGRQLCYIIQNIGLNNWQLKQLFR